MIIKMVIYLFLATHIYAQNQGTCIVDMKNRVTGTDGRKYTVEEACSGDFTFSASNCPTKCNPNYAFECRERKSGRKMCMPRFLLCDRVVDCVDKADEKNCTFWLDIPKDRQFWCDRKCIDISQRCDGVFDCYNKSDETNCTKCAAGLLTCAADHSCLPSFMRCDGIENCSDGSDEKNCSCEECIGAHSNTYMCDGTSRCLYHTHVCRPDSVCTNATSADKAYCAEKNLKKMNEKSNNSTPNLLNPTNLICLFFKKLCK